MDQNGTGHVRSGQVESGLVKIGSGLGSKLVSLKIRQGRNGTGVTVGQVGSEWDRFGQIESDLKF